MNKKEKDMQLQLLRKRMDMTMIKLSTARRWVASGKLSTMEKSPVWLSDGGAPQSMDMVICGGHCFLFPIGRKR